jgi:predicted dehydrogenase
MIKLAVIGYGYWGPRIVRNFQATEGCEVQVICDRSPEPLKRAKKAFPSICVSTDLEEVLSSPSIDAVAVVTPVFAHFAIAKAALENGKHVFVEKPFTATAEQAEKLIDLAEKNHLQIMVDHTFLFTGAVRKIRELISEGTLGNLYYYDSTRVNLGLFQHDVNVIWDLAPHDLSIVDHLVSNRPEYVTATGQTHLHGPENVAYITVYFAGEMMAHINVNWLSPVKVRTTLIGAEKKMVVWNDLEADEKIKIYDKGVQVANGEGLHQLLVSYRSGDMCAPRLEQSEALAEETKYFIECVEKNVAPFNDGHSGLRVVKILEAADRSLKARGAPVQL